jgi:hypothetical protein
MQREEGAPKQFWTRHKTQAVLRLLSGEDIDLVGRELRVQIADSGQGKAESRGRQDGITFRAKLSKKP